MLFQKTVIKKILGAAGGECAAAGDALDEARSTHPACGFVAASAPTREE